MTQWNRFDLTFVRSGDYSWFFLIFDHLKRGTEADFPLIVLRTLCPAESDLGQHNGALG